jgi:hypothetical protein
VTRRPVLACRGQGQGQGRARAGQHDTCQRLAPCLLCWHIVHVTQMTTMHPAPHRAQAEAVSSTAAQQHSSTAAQQHSSTAAQQHSSTAAQRQQHSSTAAAPAPSPHLWVVQQVHRREALLLAVPSLLGLLLQRGHGPLELGLLLLLAAAGALLVGPGGESAGGEIRASGVGEGERAASTVVRVRVRAVRVREQPVLW